MLRQRNASKDFEQVKMILKGAWVLQITLDKQWKLN